MQSKPIHRKVQVWILSTSTKRCLVLQTNQKRGRFWQPVTGTVEGEESFMQGAAREAYEETQFKFKEPPTDLLFEFQFRSQRGPAVEQCFAMLVEGEPTPTLDPIEHQAFEWLAPEDAVRRLKYPSNREGLEKALRIMFGTTLNYEAK